MRIVLQPLVRQQRTRGDVQPEEVRVHLFAHPYGGLHEARAEQDRSLQHRAKG
jgi:hypothetical protein